MYGARGTRPDLSRCVQLLSTLVTRWVGPEVATFLQQVLQYVKGTLDVVLVLDARGCPTDINQWVVDVSADADFRAPSCTSGIMLCLTPLPARDRFLPFDWLTSKQRYAKLSPAEAELIGAVLGAKVGLGWQAVFEDCGTEEKPVYQREDNNSAILAMQRGFSLKMVYVSKIYGCSIAWMGERYAVLEVIFVYEATRDMLGDPLTKLVQPDVLYRRRVICRV